MVRRRRAPAAGVPTLEEVATTAGVSRSTVSRVVNGSSRVRPDAVAAVRAAIAELHYVPNRAARMLAGSRTSAVGLLVPEDLSRFFSDPYFAEVVQGSHDTLTAADYVLNLLVTAADPANPTDPTDRRRLAQRYLAAGNVDGALVLSHHAGDVQLVELAATLPIVLGGRPLVPGLQSCCFVDVDNADGARQATRHLVQRGRRRVATIAGPLDMPAAVDRLAGWRQALQEAGLGTQRQVRSDFTHLGGAQAMRQLLDHYADLDAVFVANDLMALGALQVLAEEGRRVPADVAVVGYDDSPAATAARVPLTTVHQPSREMGVAMAEMLLTRLSGGEPAEPHVWLPTSLVVRATS